MVHDHVLSRPDVYAGLRSERSPRRRLFRVGAASLGETLVVDYINDDAPPAQIRGYLVGRPDYILFPDGDLPWRHPSWQPFSEMAQGGVRHAIRGS